MPEPLDSLFQQPLNTAIVALASAFCNLQLSRHVADYDTSNAIGLGVAQTSVVSARAVILGWQSVRNTDDAKIFLTALPMHRNWADRR